METEEDLMDFSSQDNGNATILTNTSTSILQDSGLASSSMSDSTIEPEKDKMAPPNKIPPKSPTQSMEVQTDYSVSINNNNLSQDMFLSGSEQHRMDTAWTQDSAKYTQIETTSKEPTQTESTERTTTTTTTQDGAGNADLTTSPSESAQADLGTELTESQVDQLLSNLEPEKSKPSTSNNKRKKSSGSSKGKATNLPSEENKENPFPPLGPPSKMLPPCTKSKTDKDNAKKILVDVIIPNPNLASWGTNKASSTSQSTQDGNVGAEIPVITTQPPPSKSPITRSGTTNAAGNKKQPNARKARGTKNTSADKSPTPTPQHSHGTRLSTGSKTPPAPPTKKTTDRRCKRTQNQASSQSVPAANSDTHDPSMDPPGSQGLPPRTSQDSQAHGSRSADVIHRTNSLEGISDTELTTEVPDWAEITERNTSQTSHELYHLGIHARGCYRPRPHGILLTGQCPTKRTRPRSRVPSCLLLPRCPSRYGATPPRTLGSRSGQNPLH